MSERPKEQTLAETAPASYECRTCGYVYDPDKGDGKRDIPPNTNFEALPGDWRCPVCGAPKSQFANVGARNAPSGFEENLNYGLGVNRLTPVQKNLLIFGVLALGFLFLLSLYGLNKKAATVPWKICIESLMKIVKQFAIFLALSLFCLSCSSVPSASDNPWHPITLETEAAFTDIAFTGDPKHGWLVGNQSALWETTDGGDTWQEKPLDLGEEKVSFTAVSFAGEEGWIAGEPAILLHTDDGGQTWARIPLSEKLPGSPYGIIALGPQTAEMVTNLGAIYKTTNGGRNWKALVEGAVGVARNISRSREGHYVAVSARGNFYSTWEPGQTEWASHNRTSSRRLQNMGYTDSGRLWLIARGGQIQFSQPEQVEEWEDALYPEFSTSWGLLDLKYRTPEEIWLAGGSGNLLVSRDRGETWQKDRAVEDIPANFYKIVFLSPEKGFVLGERGVLLKYEPQAAA